MTDQIQEKPMLEYVVEQLKACSGHWPDVARNTGLAYHTITKIAYQSNRDYGVKKIQRLYDYFKEKEREASTQKQDHAAA